MKVYSGNKNSLYALGVLGAAALYMVYSQFFSGPTYKTNVPQTAAVAHSGDPSDVAVPPSGAPVEKGSGPNISQAKGKVAKGAASKGKNGEFRPPYIAKKVEDRPDISTIDPTIRFDLLARAMKVPQAGASRDLFQISNTPPVTAAAALVKGPEPKVALIYGPRAPLPPAPPPPPPPIAPMVIPFKYYGIATTHPDGTHTAYFIIPGATPDLDEILTGTEGSVVKSHYKITKILADKVLVEDVLDKRQAPLNIEREATQ